MSSLVKANDFMNYLSCLNPAAIAYYPLNGGFRKKHSNTAYV